VQIETVKNRRFKIVVTAWESNTMPNEPQEKPVIKETPEIIRPIDPQNPEIAHEDDERMPDVLPPKSPEEDPPVDPNKV